MSLESGQDHLCLYDPPSQQTHIKKRQQQILQRCAAQSLVLTTLPETLLTDQGFPIQTTCFLEALLALIVIESVVTL